MISVLSCLLIPSCSSWLSRDPLPVSLARDKKDKEARKHVQFFLSNSNALKTRMHARDESVCSPDYFFLSVRGPRGLYTQLGAVDETMYHK